MFSPAGTVCNATPWIQTGWVFCSVFNLWSFFPSRSSQILSPFFLLLCQLLPGNFSLCGGTGQGTRPPWDWLPAPSPSNQARHCDALQRAAHQPETFVPLLLSHQALGESLVPPSLPTHTATTQWYRINRSTTQVSVVQSRWFHSD